jgi:hypothetical protein
MKGSAGVLVASLVALGLAAPTLSLAASGGGHPVMMRSFGLSRSFGARGEVHSRISAARERRGFGGLGASGAYTTLLSGTFPSAPDAEGGMIVPPPYPPYYVVQYVPAPPPRCVRPLLIHLVPPHPAKNLPRLVYGTPFECHG